MCKIIVIKEKPSRRARDIMNHQGNAKSFQQHPLCMSKFCEEMTTTCTMLNASCINRERLGSKLEVESMPRKEKQQKTFHTHMLKLKMISLSTKGFGT
jgi:hypothetical protein